MIKYPDKSNISKKEFIDVTIDDCNALRQGNYAKMNLRELVAFGLQSKLKKTGSRSFSNTVQDPLIQLRQIFPNKLMYSGQSLPHRCAQKPMSQIILGFVKFTVITTHCSSELII